MEKPHQFVQILTQEEIKEHLNQFNLAKRKAIQAKKALLSRAKKESISIEELDSILFGIGIDSETRFKNFHTFSPYLSDSVYWQGLRNAYELSDNHFKYSLHVRACFSSKRKLRDYLMDVAELKTLHALPEMVTIYRGMSVEEEKTGKFGISWTLRREVAEFFAFEYIRNFCTQHIEKKVVELQVPKSAIVALINSRNEEEVIYLG